MATATKREANRTTSNGKKELHASASNYKRLLSEAESLRGQSGVNAHRRATILASLFDDVDFRGDIGATDDDVVEEFLDGLVEDLSLCFAELRAMLTEFPGVDDWADGKLASLYRKTTEKIAARRTATQAVEGVTRTRRAVSLKELEDVNKEKQDLACRLNFSERQVKDGADRLAVLEKENRELRLENERLKGRIEELERLAGRVAA